MKIEDFDFGTKPKWCPGCGNFSIWVGLRQALVETKVEPHNLSVVYGIGCHGHLSNMLKCYGFESLHGREILRRFALAELLVDIRRGGGKPREELRG